MTDLVGTYWETPYLSHFKVVSQHPIDKVYCWVVKSVCPISYEVREHKLDTDRIVNGCNQITDAAVTNEIELRLLQ
jgi:hypothetical protein